MKAPEEECKSVSRLFKFNNKSQVVFHQFTTLLNMSLNIWTLLLMTAVFLGLPLKAVAAWSQWTPSPTGGNCSISCGGGVRQRIFTRTCNSTSSNNTCSGSNTRTETENCNTQSCPVCGTNLDVYLAIDGSNSINADPFRNIYLPAIADFVTSLLSMSNSRRVGYVLFSDEVEKVVELTHDANIVVTSVRNAMYPNGETSTHLGLQRIIDLFNSDTSEAARVVVVLTDGASSRPAETQEVGTTLKNSNVTIFVVGITNRVNQQEIINLASPGHDYMVHNLSQLANILSNLTKDCTATWKDWEPWSTVDCPTDCCADEKLVIRRNRTCTLMVGRNMCVGDNTETDNIACSKPSCKGSGYDIISILLGVVIGMGAMAVLAGIVVGVLRINRRKRGPTTRDS